MDRLTAAKRSELMACVRGKGTRPELAVRRMAHSMGYRFRLYGRLPGTPDLVFPGLQKVVFVHGCFWHRHNACRRTTTPEGNREFWRSKFIANQRRDRRNYAKLKQAGWDVIIVWQCELDSPGVLKRRLKKELGLYG
ncbi:MAG: DNA mismatch endonuclease Vsr [Planctomycetia bacterium]|nr:DNA mismatch endonuclease Vsr [Planctomycetia bacterium]